MATREVFTSRRWAPLLWIAAVLLVWSGLAATVITLAPPGSGAARDAMPVRGDTGGPAGEASPPIVAASMDDPPAEQPATF